MDIDRKVVLGLLDKMGAKYTNKISLKRALKKLSRYLEEEGTPKIVTHKELEVIIHLKEGGEAPAKEEPKTKSSKVPKKARKTQIRASSAINVMKELLKEGASDKAIEKAFVKRYQEKGKEDLEWVQGRVAIYRALAEN